MHSSYTSFNRDRTESFEKHKRFVDSVFEQTLLINQGKETFILYETEDDAQAACKYLQTHHINSFKSSLASSSQLTFLAIAITNEWKGVDEYFVLHWQDDLISHEAVATSNDK